MLETKFRLLHVGYGYCGTRSKGTATRGASPLTLIVVCAVWIFGCASQTLQLPGSWISTEITHPSPFFAETLSEDKQRTITFFFDQFGGFMWVDDEGICHLGTYLLQDSALVLTESQNEPIILGYTFGGDRLRLTSPDGFMFEFRRASEGAHAGAKPCIQ